MPRPYVIVTATMPDGDIAYHAVPQAEFSRWPDMRSLLEAVGKDFVRRRNAETYVEDVRGEIVDRMSVTIAESDELATA